MYLYWNKERCQQEAFKYENIKDFYIKSKSAYASAVKNKWLKEICLHMLRKIKPLNFWTKKIVK